MKAIWQEALDLLAKHGTYGKAAKASGIAQTTIYNRCEAGKRWQLEAEKVQLGGQYELPPEQFIKGVSTLVGEDGQIKAQWIKTQKEAAEQESLVEGLKEALVGAVEGVWGRLASHGVPGPPGEVRRRRARRRRVGRAAGDPGEQAARVGGPPGRGSADRGRSRGE